MDDLCASCGTFASRSSSGVDVECTAYTRNVKQAWKQSEKACRGTHNFEPIAAVLEVKGLRVCPEAVHSVTHLSRPVEPPANHVAAFKECAPAATPGAKHQHQHKHRNKSKSSHQQHCLWCRIRQQHDFTIQLSQPRGEGGNNNQ